MKKEITGGCLCGVCRYKIGAEPINVRVCHCRVCQKAIGASFNARVLVPLDQLVIHGDVAWYASSSELQRGFCPHCGTTMFSRRASKNVVGITMGSLDDPNLFMPDAHIWVSSKQQWLALCDDEPQHMEGF